MRSHYLAFYSDKRSNIFSPERSNTDIIGNISETNINLFFSVEVIEMIQTKVSSPTT